MLTIPLRPERYSEAARTLARAYLDDPGLGWVLPDRQRREARLRWLFERRIRGIAAAGACTITAGSEGVALWLPPQSTDRNRLWPALRPGVALAPLIVGPGAVRRLLRLEHNLRRRHRRLLRDASWLLLALGVDPRSQGDGVGRALLHSGLERSDASGAPAFLVTHNARNLELFAAHGFEIVADGPITRGGPMTWSMRREPRSASSAARDVG